MSALTNYDRFAGIGDDEEAEEAAARPPRPVVTRLDNASTITIGGGGWSAAPTPAPAPKPKPAGGIDYSRWDHLDDSESDGEPNRYIEDDVFREREEEWKAEAAAAAPTPAPVSREVVADATLDGGLILDAASAPAVAWAQTADDVAIRFRVDGAAKGADVKLTVAYDGDARACALSLEAPGARLRGLLAHDVWCEGDDRPTFKVCLNDAEAAALKELDWVLEPARAPLPTGAKCVVLCLKKRSFAVDVVAWWPTLFRKDAAPAGLAPETPRDTRALAGRVRRGAKTAGVQAAWDGAHAAFLDKVQAGPPAPVDIA